MLHSFLSCVLSIACRGHVMCARVKEVQLISRTRTNTNTNTRTHASTYHMLGRARTPASVHITYDCTYLLVPTVHMPTLPVFNAQG